MPLSRFPARRLAAPLLALAASALLGGCVGTVTKVATAPVRVVGKGVDLATTSQSEADENRGRKMRKRLDTLERQYKRERKACQKGDQAACDAARADYARIEDLRGD
ncbi:hypothetical protein MTR62_05680 [Novosphingobium sp. 1949]|uniref:Lipoprotein n=1 Tax=Novosphingobium organovorum TaxID=2930092 RepID=A0ABT0BBL2_9SPHN|nr:hypothetical protein [Novosphingobium organovorum]MCJ2182189.1 hypothetical protein [Novosphingobium organovorum]